MDNSLYQKLVARIPLFKTLTPKELGAIVEISKLLKVQKDMQVVKEGSRGGAMYMLVEGKCRVDKAIPGGPTAKIARIVAPSVFGEMSLIDGNPRSASVTTLTDTVLLQVDLQTFNRLRAGFHPAAFKILRELARTLCQRLDEKTRRITEFYKNPKENLQRLQELFNKR